MEIFYIAVFLLSAVAAAALEGTRKSATGSEIGNRDFLKFRNNYVLVYSLMMGKHCMLHYAWHKRCWPANSLSDLQLVTGFKGLLSMPCISTMTLTELLLASFSLLALARL